MSKFYRFDFDKGIPIGGSGPMKWRKGIKTVSAYSLQGAVEKLVMPLFREWGLKAKLNVLKAWSSQDKTNWNEINLGSVEFAAFIVGCLERAKSELPS